MAKSLTYRYISIKLNIIKKSICFCNSVKKLGIFQVFIYLVFKVVEFIVVQQRLFGKSQTIIAKEDGSSNKCVYKNNIGKLSGRKM